MSTALREHTVGSGTGNGGVPARRAVVRWAWRLFRREWRQQLLVLALIVVAVAATIVAAAVATNTPPPANAGFGTAKDLWGDQPRRVHRRGHLCGVRGTVRQVLDYAGPNLASNQLIVYTPNGAHGPGGPGAGAPRGAATQGGLRSMAASAHRIAAALGSHDMIQLDTTSATLQHAAGGRNWSGPVYVATPQLLRAFGIKASGVDPTADILTMRPGLDTMSKMQLLYGNYVSGSPGAGSPCPGCGGPASFPCPKSDCLANPAIQAVSGLPSGTSAPNTVITEHAIHELGLHPVTSGWLIQTAHPPPPRRSTTPGWRPRRRA